MKNYKVTTNCKEVLEDFQKLASDPEHEIKSIDKIDFVRDNYSFIVNYNKN